MSGKKLIMPSVLFMALAALFLTAEAGNRPDAWLGIYTQTVDEDLKEAFDLNSDYGVIIKLVVPDSPADKAGLKQGDVILKFSGDKLADSDQLIGFVRNHDPGDEVEIEIMRKGKEKELVVELGSRQDYDDADRFLWKHKGLMPHVYSKTYKSKKSVFSDSYIGLQLENMNAQLGEYFGVEDGEGALVTEVIEDSPASEAGLKAGDVVIEVDGDKVTDPSDVQEAICGKDEGDEVELIVLRDKQEKKFTLQVAESPDDFYSFDKFPAFLDLDDDFIFMPRMKGLFRGTFDHDMTDMEEMREWMDNLQEELKELRRELKEIQEKLE